MEMKEVELSTKFGQTHIGDKINALRKDMLKLGAASKQIHDLELQNCVKDDELKLLKSSLKYSLVKELQVGKTHILLVLFMLSSFVRDTDLLLDLSSPLLVPLLDHFLFLCLH